MTAFLVNASPSIFALVSQSNGFPHSSPSSSYSPILFPFLFYAYRLDMRTVRRTRETENCDRTLCVESIAPVCLARRRPLTSRLKGKTSTHSNLLKSFCLPLKGFCRLLLLLVVSNLYFLPPLIGHS